MSFPVELPFRSYCRANLANLTVASGYDLETARAMAWLSQLAYETRDEGKVRDVLREWRLSPVTFIKDPSGSSGLTDTNGLVVDGWGARIIAFTGTDPLKLKDWLTDARTGLSSKNIHEGFDAGFEAVRSQVEAAIRDCADGLKRLLITGHSLGGALAGVAANSLRDNRQTEIDGVYTFGMPRCGGEFFAAAYEGSLGARTYRFVHGADVVPTLPPSTLGKLRFSHVGRLLKCPHGGSFQEGTQPPDGPSDEPQFAGSARQAISDIFAEVTSMVLPRPTQPGLLGRLYSWLPPSIGDHLPSRYLRAFGDDLRSDDQATGQP
jgi:triacylglycerol lipase